jgi:glycosyltransferase involved in cell wall biosynthesis
MVQVHVVTVEPEWILRWIATRIVETANSLGEEWTLGFEPRDDVEINFYVDLYNCYRGKTKVKDVGWFTCLDKNSLESFQPHWHTLDFVVQMNSEQMKKWIEAGYPKEKMVVLKAPFNIENFPLRKIVLGIFQRGGFVGKGHNFMLKLPDVMDLSNFKFIFVGKGWDDIFLKYRKSGIQVEYYADEVYSTYPLLYKKIDYLLIPSLWEGGPIALLEALAQGIPVIASRVGFVANGELKVDYVFEPNNHLELAEILMKLEKERLERRKQVEGLSYERWVKRLKEVFEECLES